MSRVRVLLNSPINRARSPSPRPTWLLRLLVLAILRSHPRRTLSLPRPLRHGREQLPPGSRRSPFIFYHRASSPLSRVSARSSFAPSSGSAKFIASLLFSLSRIFSFSLPSYLSIRPSVRSSEVRKYRLVCSMTRRLLLRSFLPSPPLPLHPPARERERIFFLAAASPLSFFAARASFCVFLSFSLFLLVGRMVDIISAAAFHRINPSRIIGVGQQEETYTTATVSRNATRSRLCC